MIRRHPRELKSHLQGPDRVNRVKRDKTPLCFVKRFKRVNARLLKLRPNQPFDQLLVQSADPFRENDSAVALIELRESRRNIAMDDRRTFPCYRRTDTLLIISHEFETLMIWRIFVDLIKLPR